GTPASRLGRRGRRLRGGPGRLEAGGARTRARRAVSPAHRTLQATEGLRVSCRAAEEQYGQGAQDRVARDSRVAARMNSYYGFFAQSHASLPLSNTMRQVPGASSRQIDVNVA